MKRQDSMKWKRTVVIMLVLDANSIKLIEENMQHSEHRKRRRDPMIEH